MVPRHDFSTRDAQVCLQCGSRYGQCKHTTSLPHIPAPTRHSETDRWTEGEDDLVIDLHWLEGMGISSIATRLGRSICAVEHRIRVIEKRAEHSRTMEALRDAY